MGWSNQAPAARQAYANLGPRGPVPAQTRLRRMDGIGGDRSVLPCPRPGHHRSPCHGGLRRSEAAALTWGDME